MDNYLKIITGRSYSCFQIPYRHEFFYSSFSVLPIEVVFMTAKIAIIFTLIHTMVIETILKFKLLMVGEFIIEINLLIFRSIATTLVMLTDERSPSDGKHLENMIDARFILLLVNSSVCSMIQENSFYYSMGTAWIICVLFSPWCEFVYVV